MPRDLPSASPTPPRILVIEDEPAIADTLAYALRTEGFAPVWRATGGEGLAELAAADAAAAFALVILDVGLPDANGFDVCRKIRARSAVPVLFLTARGGELLASLWLTAWKNAMPDTYLRTQIAKRAVETAGGGNQ